MKQDLDSNGDLVLTDEYADFQIATIPELSGLSYGDPYAGVLGALFVLKLKNPHLKIGISVGGWGRDANFPIVASDANNKQQVIVNNNVTEVTTNDKGTGEEVSVIFKLANDNDKISIKVASESWFKADGFQLFYYGKNSSKQTSAETGVENIIATSEAIDIYTINGVKVATLQNGLNIIRTKNGVKKVMKK